MGMDVVRCLKILALLSLVPLALRAGSLVGHVVAPLPSSSTQPAARIVSRSVSSSATAEEFHQGSRRRMEANILAAGLNTARFRPGGGGGQGGFGDEKRMAPSGSNPLHNLR